MYIMQQCNTNVTFQGKYWCTFTLLSLNPSSFPSSLSGMLLPQPGTRADKGISSGHHADKVFSCNLPSLQDLCTSRTLRQTGKVSPNPSHSRHKLSQLASGPTLMPTASFLLKLDSSTRQDTS